MVKFKIESSPFRFLFILRSEHIYFLFIKFNLDRNKVTNNYFSNEYKKKKKDRDYSLLLIL